MAFSSATGYQNLPNGNFSPVIYSKQVQLAFRKSTVVGDITNSTTLGRLLIRAIQSGLSKNLKSQSSLTLVAHKSQRRTLTMKTLHLLWTSLTTMLLKWMTLRKHTVM